MGLDQYAYVTPDTGDLPHVDLDWNDDNGHHVRPRAKIAQWRKHPDLHDWCKKLYRQRDGTNPRFNCATLRLTADDIDLLKTLVEQDLLPESKGGFFFGNTLPEDKWATIEFCWRAGEAIRTGMAVYYDSWW